MSNVRHAIWTTNGAACARHEADFVLLHGVSRTPTSWARRTRPLRILANVVNATGSIWRAERAFLPAVGPHATLMREDGLPLFSHRKLRARCASSTPSASRWPHELAATNVLEALDLAGIPLRAEDRGEDDPFVHRRRPVRLQSRSPTPCSSTPCIVGEGEEAVPEALLEPCAACAREGASAP